MIRLVCIDVDGTLIGTSGVVAPESWAAATRARAAGIRLAICSGRPAFGRALEYAERLDPDGWHIFQNGSSVVHLAGGETRSHALPVAAVLELIGRSRTNGRILELYTDIDYFVESTAPRARQHAQLLGIPFVRRDLDTRAGTIVRAQWIVSHAEAAAVLAEPHAGLTVAASLSPVMPDATFINCTPVGVDKGYALQRVAEEYGLTAEQVMMVGDSGNDLSALRVAGYPVAMGNAEPPVRHAAARVVGDVDRGGLVEALELAMELAMAGRRD
jgi:Cof subfamily protein (haloacid dehalogenase superfamily)